MRVQESNEFLTWHGKALNGYDVVTFFEGKPTLGSSRHSLKWQDTTWYFINEMHRDAFSNDPMKYAPQYGGYCAYGVSNGYKAEVSIACYTVFDNKLYFNFSPYIQTFWRANKGRLISKADREWQAISNEKPISVNRLFIYLKYRWFRLTGRDFFSEAR